MTLCQALKAAGVDVINISTGQTVSDEKPVYGRMFQVPVSDRVRHAADIPTIVAGNLSSADQADTILMAGRADLVALARPHLSDPTLTQKAAAWYGVDEDALWPEQYHSAMFQTRRMAEKEKADWLEMKRALKPPSHEVKNGH